MFPTFDLLCSYMIENKSHLNVDVTLVTFFFIKSVKILRTNILFKYLTHPTFDRNKKTLFNNYNIYNDNHA